ncbi:MAG: efflux RND transporter permease subunit [Gemmataceae bacterium]|nr:efflux RND transporter permease subunit [Gemmataceae bacterium]
MLNALIRFALRFRPLIVVLSVVALVAGGYSAATLPIDVFPDLDRPRVSIMTECPGLAAEEVESLVTAPLEAAVLGAQGVQDVRSQSGPGLSAIKVEFDWGMDIAVARQVVEEQIDAAETALPPDIHPQLAPVSSIMGQILVAGVYRDPPKPDDLELRTLGDWIIRPRLLQVPGVSQVFVMGGGRKQYQVRVDPAALIEHGVNLDEVAAAVRKNNLNTTGGFATVIDREVPVRVLGRLGPQPDDVLRQLLDIPVRDSPARTITLRQVADVVEAAGPARGDASVNGRPGILLTVAKQPNTDTRHVTEEITRALRDIAKTLPKGITIVDDIFQQRAFIDRGIHNVLEALAIGAVLVLIVLFLFLLNTRTTFISLTAIPLSLALTALVFKLVSRITGTELSINVMTLGGLAVAMGELVDDAIVDVENIYRRLRENAASDRPRPILRVIYQASVEVRSAIVFGTAMVVLVFLPLFALPGIEGRIFAPLGEAYIVSILMSLIVSLTVTPVLSYYLIGGVKAGSEHADGPLLRFLKWVGDYVVRFSMHFAGSLLAVAWVLVFFSGWLLFQLGADFLPPFDEGAVQINLTLESDASLAASNRASAIVDAKLREMKESPERPKGAIRQFARRSGRAELEEHADPPNATEYTLTVNPDCGKPRQDVIEELLKTLGEELPGVDLEIEQPLQHLIRESLSGVTAQIAIRISGDDLGMLTRIGKQVKAAAAGVPGLTPPILESLARVEEFHVRLKPEALSLYGLDRTKVAELVQTAVRGDAVTQVVEGQRRFDVVVRLADPWRTDLSRLGDLRIELPGKRGTVQLKELAAIGPGDGANQVKRDNARRRLVVRCNALGRDLGSVVEDLRVRLDAVPLPVGYSLVIGGEFENQQRATRLIFLLAGASVVGMFVVLLMLFPSVRIVLQVLNAIPVAFVGGVFALALSGQPLTVASLVGFISLGGIAARNGILLMTHYVHLMRHEGEEFTKKMILRGSLERLAPVLMTALTAGIGLIPLVIGGRQPGREILYPVATVILGGLITSTLCEFLLHPGIFWKFSGRSIDRLIHAAHDPFLE